ncbi:MAG: hypothetical protein DBY43_06105 [Clostridiaceae bacterium]|nr:MAG: hypothetical protein DBY43_06105 [Clostridiaceae bacterium]
MQESISKDKNKLKIFSSLLIIVLLIMGVSFAVFQNFARQSGTNNLGATNCFSVTFEGVNNAINLANDYPIPDSEGLERDPYTFKVTNNCNQYLTLSIGVETLSTSEIPSNLIKGVIVNNGGIPTTASILSSGKTMEAQNGGIAYELLTDGLGANSSKTYDLRLWFDESMTKEQGASKKYQGRVIVGVSADVEPPKNLREAILANNEVKVPLTTPGSEVSAHTKDDVESQSASLDTTEQAYYITYGTGWTANGSNFNLTGAAVTSDTYANSYSSLIGKYLPYSSLLGSGSSTAGTMKPTTNLKSVYYVVSATSSSFVYKQIISNKNTTEALLASTEDDYGTSYYFRGAVKNNYVEFANKCWRIVRIIGDGSVKLVLHNDNTAGAANPCSSANNSTNAAFARYSGTTYTSAFNEKVNDNAYVGFMYGQAGASDYASTHANTNKSTILTNLEKWYTNNLATYESKLADTIWCNDKSTFTTYTSGSTYGTGLGYGTNQTGYGAYNRIYGGNHASYASPSLICPNDNNGGKLSKFTVSDTTNGNGNLTYKIGLLTADELAFAGFKDGYNNCSTYLQENTGKNWWWSLSPDFFKGSAYTWYINSGSLQTHTTNSGYLYYFNVGKNNGCIRPSISLKSTTNVTGEGTSENPYKVV